MAICSLTDEWCAQMSQPPTKPANSACHPHAAMPAPVCTLYILCVYVYIYMYTLYIMYTYICIYIHTHIHIHIYTIYIYRLHTAYTNMLHVCVYVCVCVCVYKKPADRAWHDASYTCTYVQIHTGRDMRAGHVLLMHALDALDACCLLCCACCAVLCLHFNAEDARQRCMCCACIATLHIRRGRNATLHVQHNVACPVLALQPNGASSVGQQPNDTCRTEDASSCILSLTATQRHMLQRCILCSRCVVYIPCMQYSIYIYI